MYRLTADGHAQYTAELTKLQKSRPEIVTELSRASELGDRSENAAYRVAKSQLRQRDNRIRFLEKVLTQARVVSPGQTQTASLGAHITLLSDKGTVTYRLVDSIQSDLARGDLSIRSPLGSALLHKACHAAVSITTPRGISEYTITRISLDRV